MEHEHLYLKHRSGEDYKRRCFERWTIDELIQEILDRPFSEPCDVIFDFMIKMNKLANMTNHRDDIFIIARDTAQTVLQMYSDSEF